MLSKSLYFYNPAPPVTVRLCKVVNKKTRQPVIYTCQRGFSFVVYLYALALMPLYSFFFPDHFFKILYRHPPVAVSLRPCQPFNHMQTVPLRIAAENEKPKRVAFFSLEMSRDQLVQRGDPLTELIIAKHRNGPTGKVDLFFKNDCTKFVSLNEKDA